MCADLPTPVDQEVYRALWGAWLLSQDEALGSFLTEMERDTSVDWESFTQGLPGYREFWRVKVSQVLDIMESAK